VAQVAGLALTLAALACNPGSVAFREARKAEQRKDYDTAIINYEKALQYEPENPRYLIGDKLARTKSGAFHLNQGLRLLSEGRTEEAAGEFRRAASVDPTNEAARQQLTKVLAEEAAAKAARDKALKQALTPPPPPPLQAGVQLKPLPAEPLAHFRISGDSRKVFEALGQLADINVVFNYDFQPRPLSLDLTRVKLEDALQAAAYESHVFWKPISSNTILIIPDSPTNRREYEDEVLKTYHLSNPLAAAERTQISTALKQVLGLQRVIDNPSSNSIIIRDTPDKVTAAEDVIKALDLSKGEVLIDVTILEADRNRMTTLGIIPASQLTLVPTSTVTASTATGTVTAGTFPLNQPFVFGEQYSLVLPTAQAQAVLSDATTRVLENPEIRATDGQVAKLKIGQRIPYATGSFLPSFTGTTGTGNNQGLLASTQFQYQDIGVNLEITPHLTASGDIALHAKVEVSTNAGSLTIGGLAEPIFGQRVVEHDIQLKEGEVSLLGGLIDREYMNNVNGLPFLGDVPLLKYLFSTTTKNVTDNEVLIMLNPHVVRLPEVAADTAASVSAAAGPVPIEPAVVPPVPGVPPR
jgi:general secretion pathway protein D